MEKHWLTRPRTIRRLWWFFATVLAATVLAELFVAHEADFSVERLTGFYALFGFVACVAMILFAKAIGSVLKRPDTYYAEKHDE
ncbi:MAG TPA: hypothetical protein VGA88_02765 [Burkholderiales bacterium]|jgi:hypothetical protein